MVAIGGNAWHRNRVLEGFIDEHLAYFGTAAFGVAVPGIASSAVILSAMETVQARTRRCQAPPVRERLAISFR